MALAARDLTGNKRRSLRKPLAGDVAMRSLLERAKLELIPMKSLERAIDELSPNSSVSMTCSPATSIEATLDETGRLLADGHRVTPHISARMVRDHDHLRAIHDRLGELGIREIFVVGGDAEPPGIFFDAIEFLDAFLAVDDADGSEHRQVDHIGYTSYPDTHPAISKDALHEALHRKQEQILSTGRTAHVATQMCFDPDQIRTWLRAEREAGLTVPVHIGVAGVVDTTKLMTMGVRLGVGTSLRYLSKNRRAITKLLTQRSYRPDQLLRPLAGDLDELGIEGLHLFTFNQVASTATWRDHALRSPAPRRSARPS